MDKPIRVLHIFGRLDRGGAETVVMNLFRNIDRSLIQFDFIKHTEEDCSYDEEIISLGGKIYSIPKYKVFNQTNYKQVWNTFFSNHPEYNIVHGHMRSTASIYLKIANQHKRTTIAHSHSISNGRGTSALIKNIMQLPLRNTADYLFACTKEAGEWLFGKNVNQRKNYYILKNAVDLEEYKFDKSIRTMIRENLKVQNKLLVGHVGRFIKPKNQEFLLDIFMEIIKINKNAVLMLVGDGKDKAKIINKINYLGIEDKVILTGERSDVSELMQAMDVFIFPSIYEGLGMVVIEAQISGLPCLISTNVPDEVNLTSDIKGLSLKKNASDWAKECNYISENYIRKDNQESVKEAGYDIMDTSKWLSGFYISLVGN